MITRNSDDDDDSADEARNNRPARLINPNEFLTLMATFDGPIDGKFLNQQPKTDKFVHKIVCIN